MATSTEEWIEELKGISVLELSERIKALEEEFGVSATACSLISGSTVTAPIVPSMPRMRVPVAPE